ncbi:hypothetical protein RFI_00319 [Reticulomyxa filosa]|uniref:MsrB domain-containing protein n=1 Tax=Reticulomyxa filosa TaxID=46433 RepID=X6PF60_RETFI|nr:hypothetical protein RFI_00319 [Reticulomyxa filosa]|eukprot:ETO36743.1 hypothetical protein RFI_00319 [Reticulomyxa filosa]
MSQAPDKTPSDTVSTDDKYWKENLSEGAYKVLREGHTEMEFGKDPLAKGLVSSESAEHYANFPTKGYFVCRGCQNPLYTAAAKFNAGCGWPAFDKCLKGSIKTFHEYDSKGAYSQTELRCAKCNGHLGHVFLLAAGKKQIRDSSQHHCVNSIAIKYVDKEVPKDWAENEVEMDPIKSIEKSKS